MNEWKRFMEDETAAGVIEMVLIIVVLIGLVMIFRDELTKIVNNIFKTISSKAGSIK